MWHQYFCNPINLYNSHLWDTNQDEFHLSQEETQKSRTHNNIKYHALDDTNNMLYI